METKTSHRTTDSTYYVRVTAYTFIVAAVLFFAMGMGSRSHDTDPSCSAERIAALRGGLEYVEGFRAARITAGQPTARADRNIEVNRNALAECGIQA